MSDTDTSGDRVPVGNKPERHEFLDTWVDGMTVPDLVDQVVVGVQGGKQMLVANHNVNSLVLLQHDEQFRDFYERPDLIFVDGAAVVPLARALGADVRMKHRVAVLDWLWPMCAEAERRGWRLVHLGGTQEVLDKAAAVIVERHPKLSFQSIHGFFDVEDPEQNRGIVERLRDLRPDVLLVGMGMPRQERWLHDHLEQVPPCVVITVGGILSFLGEDRPTPPRWLGRLGLEWLYRLATEPRRLWRRYLLEPLVLVPVLVRAAAVKRSAARSGQDG